MHDQIEESEITLQDVLLHLAHAQTQYPGGLPLAEMQQAEERSTEDLPEAPAGTSWGNKDASLAFVLTGANTTESFDGPRGELVRAIIEKGMRKPLSEVAVFFEADIQHAGLPESVSDLIVFGASLPVSTSGVAPVSSLPAGTPVVTDRGVCLVTYTVEEILAAPDRKKEFWLALQQFLARIHGQAA